ncbi:hypothetical protein [Rhodococcus sp. Q]|uniref:hypothetical protein n=1 Tax=Rhodococcus sp. Q TaxID=2502252 RepID=UPI0020169B5E|nr:hypothetical protein [Rhodococcus sp. Q]
MDVKRWFVPAVLVLIGPLALGACADGGETGPPPSTSTTSVAVTTTETTAIPETTLQASTTTAALAPVTFDCGDLSAYESGTALYSDGTVGYEAVCDTYVPPPTTEAAKVLRYCDYPGTAVYMDGTYSSTDPACAAMRAEAEARENPNPNPGGGYPYDPEEDRNGDGVVHGYERCGVLCGKAPTSGDIQTQDGCEQGYIDREICSRYGW